MQGKYRMQCLVRFERNGRRCAFAHYKSFLTFFSPQNVIFCDLNESGNLLFEHDRKVFCTSPVLYLSSILPFDSRLCSVLPPSHNPSPEF